MDANHTSAQKSIGILVGSLRKDSYGKVVAQHLIGLLQDQLDVRIIDLSALSFYNQDLDNATDMPDSWKVLRREAQDVDAFIFITAEYNRSVMPVLKNALDIASLPQSESGWNGKPGAIISLSPGRLGGFGAYHHLRQTISYLNVYLMNQPEMYLSNIAGSISEGAISDEGVQRHLQKFASAYTEWINRF